ncbi:hypothetical protein PQX77_019693 [Marasmius sp. AFHP31]|nr:hypothetical protein PQX77_019693 [Marasmius sp. AFHP31]
MGSPSTTQHFSPPNCGFSHPNPNPQRPLLANHTPSNIPTAPCSDCQLARSTPSVSETTTAGTAPIPQPSTSRPMTQQNAVAFHRHMSGVLNTAGTHLSMSENSKGKQAELSLPVPRHLEGTRIQTPLRNETVADNRRRLEENEITLEGMIRQQGELHQWEHVLREREAQRDRAAREQERLAREEEIRQEKDSRENKVQQEWIAREREMQFLRDRLESLEQATTAQPANSDQQQIPPPLVWLGSMEGRILDFATQQIRVQRDQYDAQQSLIKDIMNWQMQWVLGHHIRDVAQWTSTRKRSRSHSQSPGPSTCHQRRRISCQPSSASSSSRSRMLDNEDRDGDGVPDVVVSLPSPGQMTQDNGDELEYLDVAPLQNVDSTTELDSVSLSGMRRRMTWW